jgi:hypothetical protein
VATPYIKTVGGAGEAAIAAWLSRVLRTNVDRGIRGSGYDYLANGHRIECKTGIYSKETGFWTLSIHRHAVINEASVDYYVFRLEGCPFWSAAIHLVIPAPLERSTICISLRSLVIKWSRFIDATDALRAPGPFVGKSVMRTGNPGRPAIISACAYGCGAEYGVGKMIKHIRVCPKRPKENIRE